MKLYVDLSYSRHIFSFETFTRKESDVEVVNRYDSRLSPFHQRVKESDDCFE